MKKPWRKCAPKANSRPLFSFGKKPKQPLHARNSFTNQMFWKRIIKKFYKRELYFSFEDELYVIRMSLVCTRMYHSYVIRTWFYHEPLPLFSILYDDFLKFSENRQEFKLGSMYFKFLGTRNYITCCVLVI